MVHVTGRMAARTFYDFCAIFEGTLEGVDAAGVGGLFQAEAVAGH